MSRVVDSSNTHADQVHPIDILLGLNLVSRQAKVMSGPCGTVMLKIPQLTFMCRMMCRSRISSQYLMPICESATCTRAILLPWWIPAHTMTLQPPKQCLWCLHQHVTGENETHLRTEQSSTWHVSISTSVGSTADAALSRGVQTLCPTGRPRKLPASLNWLQTVWSEILCSPGICVTGCCGCGSISYPDVSILSSSVYFVMTCHQHFEWLCTVPINQMQSVWRCQVPCHILLSYPCL